MGSQSGVDPELDLGGGFNCLFHVKGSLTILFASGNIAFWGGVPPLPHPVSAPGPILNVSSKQCKKLVTWESLGVPSKPQKLGGP